MAIQKGDFVEVLKGEFKGEFGKVLQTSERMIAVLIGKITINVEKDQVKLA